MSTSAMLSRFIQSHVRLVEPLARQAALADWQLQTQGSSEAIVQATEAKLRLSRVYADKENFAFLDSLAFEQIEPSVLARQGALLRMQFLSGQMDESLIDEIVRLEIEVEDRFNRHRAVVDGEILTDNDIDHVLASSRDTARRKAVWEASKTVGGEICASVLKLVELRNREARRLGFRSYFQLALELQEIDETELFDLLERLKALSDDPWHAYKSRLDARMCQELKVGARDLRPWHYTDRFFQEAMTDEVDLDRYYADKRLPELAAAFFRTIGLPADDVLKRSDLFEREGKSQHAFCVDIDRAGDVRVLCNIRPNERWMDTMLHELGHAVFDKFHDPDLPFLLREPAHTMATEAVALLMGRFSKNPDWMQRYAGVSPEEARQVAAGARKQARENLLVFTRWSLVVTHFERSLYENPFQDLSKVWWDLVEQFQGIYRPDGQTAPDWAAKIHIATTPVYYHNYLLGETVASQLLHHLRHAVLFGQPNDALVSSPLVGEYLRNRLFRPGAVRRWDAWLEHATGEPLNPAYFARELNGDGE
jgi:peptidyl-dipeptidase A